MGIARRTAQVYDTMGFELDEKAWKQAVVIVSFMTAVHVLLTPGSRTLSLTASYRILAVLTVLVCNSRIFGDRNLCSVQH
jgi:hypothetical protein